MDLWQLEAFTAVVDENGFTRAGARLLRTQPALSLLIRRLERELGERLFERRGRSVILTEAGEALLPYARRLLNLRDEAKEAVAELKGLGRGRLRLGANESTSLYLLPPLLLGFRRRHPNVTIEVDRLVSERVPAEVRDRRLDFGFLAYEPSDPALDSFEVFRDTLALVVPPGHRFAGRRSVRVPELGAETFVAHNARTPARERVVELFARHATPLRITIELSTLETIKDFVRRGVGLAILPRLTVADELARGTLVSVPVAGMRIEKPTRLVFRREGTPSHAARAFLELVRSEGTGLVASARARSARASGGAARRRAGS